MKLALSLLAAVSAFSSIALAQTAQVKAYCRSLSLEPTVAITSSWVTNNLYFTTYDTNDAVLPHYIPTATGTAAVSSELRLVNPDSGLYRADYLLLYSGFPSQYGTLAMTIPTVDADRNGITDVIEPGKPFYASVTSSGYSTWQSSNSFRLDTRFTREAGSLTGIYSGTWTGRAGNYSLYGASLRLLSIEGNATYLRRRQNQVQWKLTRHGEDGSSETLTGASTYTVEGSNTVYFPQFTLTGDQGGVYTNLPMTLKRSGHRYVGNATFVDGSPATPWPDYVDWVMEITDPNDEDEDGTPDFSDPSAVRIPTSRLSLLIHGPGTVTPNLDMQMLELGKSYRVVANPAAGCVFSNWVGNGSVLATTRALTFVMQTNLALEANFVANPFAPARGTYYGLIAGTNGVAPESSGSIKAAVTEGGAYSATVRLGGSTYAASGSFDLTGKATARIARPYRDPLRLELQLALDGSDLLAGTVRDGIVPAEITAKKCPAYSTTNACPYAGKYTLVLAGEERADDSMPFGFSYGTVTVDKRWGMKLSGSLADGKAVTQGTAMSGAGDWPFYVCTSTNGSCAFGWLSFTTFPGRSVGTTATWLKLRSPVAKYYPAGFTNEQVAVTTSPYRAPARGERVLEWTNGVIAFEGGELPEFFSTGIVLDGRNKAYNAGTNKLALSFVLPSGRFTGSVRLPGEARSTPLHGVLLQQPGLGCGYFLDGQRSGRIMLGVPAIPVGPGTNQPPLPPGVPGRPGPQ